MRDHIQQVPPQSPESEQSVIGSILVDYTEAGHLLDELPADDFYSDRHRVIWRAMQALRARGDVPDLITTAEELRRAGTFEQAGGLTYLTHVWNGTASAANAAAHAAIVMERARRRRSIQRLRHLVDRLYDLDEDLGDIAVAAAWAVEDAPGEYPDVRLLGDVAVERVAALRSRRPGEIPGRTTGYPDLDRISGGLEPGALYIVAARPGMGKTGLALSIAERSAEATGLPWLIVSREMGEGALADRAVASSAKVSAKGLRRSRLGEDGWTRAEQAAMRLRGVPVYVSTQAKSPKQIRERLRALAKRTDREIGGVMVDYLQLLKLDERPKGISREQEVAEISRSLKDLAVDLRVPVLALSQLSRAVEQRDDKRPTLADLRESGQLEADAEAVWALYRPAYYARLAGEDVPPVDTVEVIQLKHRNEQPATITLIFQPGWVRFEQSERRVDEREAG